MSLFAAVVVASCTPEPPSEAASPRASATVAGDESPLPEPAPVPRCPNADDVTSDPSLRSGGVLEGDVDGDGNDDRVRVNVDKSAPRGCQAFVTVETGEGQFSGAIWELGSDGGLPQPTLSALVEINGAPGLEIVVNEASGASTQFVGAFALVTGELARLQPPAGEESGVATELTGLFAYGGSVGHVEAVNCSDEGEIVVTLATPVEEPRAAERGIYRVERQFFAVDAATLLPIDATRSRVRIAEFQERFPEFAAAPFSNCPS